MIISVIPDVIDALVVLASTALGTDALVLDGFGVIEETAPAYVMVGIPDPLAEAGSASASVEQSWASVGARSRDEEGVIALTIYAINGDADQKSARDLIFDIARRIAEAVTADLTLGGAPGLLWSAFRVTDLEQSQTQHGAEALLNAQLAFRSRI